MSKPDYPETPPFSADFGGDVGPRKPPKHTQFQKGVSGNAKGRPKGSKNLGTLLLEAARDQVTATIGGKPWTISKLQATVMQLATKAAAGDRAAIAKLLDWIDEFERRASAARPPEFPFGPADLEVLRGIHTRMSECLSAERDGLK